MFTAKPAALVRLFSFLVIFLLIFALLPASAFAEESAEDPTMGTLADTAIDLSDYSDTTSIQTDLQAALNALGVGETLTVTGTNDAVTNKTVVLYLDLPANTTIIWKAAYTYTGTEDAALKLYGSGTFVVEEEADIKGVNPGSSYSDAIHLWGSVTLEVRGGQISGSGTTCYTIWGQDATTTIHVSGGTITVSGSSSRAIAAVGTLTVSGGTIESTGINSDTIAAVGLATISGGTITNTGYTSSAVYVTGALEVSDGIILNTGENSSGIFAIGTLTITGGAVINTSTSPDSQAITIDGVGAVGSISGGIVLGRGTTLAEVITDPRGVLTDATGNGIIAAWALPGAASYVEGTSADLAVVSTPGGSLAWKYDDASATGGISYALNTNTGFVPLGVSIETVRPVDPTPTPSGGLAATGDTTSGAPVVVIALMLSSLTVLLIARRCSRQEDIQL